MENQIIAHIESLNISILSAETEGITTTICLEGGDIVILERRSLATGLIAIVKPDNSFNSTGGDTNDIKKFLDIFLKEENNA